MSSTEESSERWTLLNSLCDRFEDAWLCGKNPRVEDYLAEVPARWAAEARREIVTLDLHYRRQAGLAVATSGYLERFPELDRQWLEQQLVESAASQSAGAVAKSRRSSADKHRIRPVLPGFEVLELLGRGGMGVVYKARQLDLNRLVAIKMILAGEHAAPETVARFRAEARAVAQLQHPGLVQIFEVGEFNGRLYLTFEYVPGGSLDKRLNGIPQPPRTSVKLVRELAHATQFAHNRSIVHRDLKPGNVLLLNEPGPAIASDPLFTSAKSPAASRAGSPTPISGTDFDFGHPKIADFGLAKQLGADESHTVTGALIGSPSYMAPEQASGDPSRVGPAADIYALGAILYEMLTGRPPFRAATVADTLQQVRNDEPISLRRLQPSIPRDLETICLKCLQKDPRQRYESAGALADDLDRYLRDEPVLARPVTATERTYRWCRRHPAVALLIALLAVVTLGGMAGMGWLWHDASEQRDLAGINANRYRAERDVAEQQRKLAETNRETAERRSYYHGIGQSFGEWQGFQVGRAIQRLDDCPPELRGWEWRYLNTLFRQDLMTLAGHSDEVRRVACSPDGKTLVSGTGVFGWDRPGEMILWDRESGQQKRIVQAHAGPLLGISWAANGSRFATCGTRFAEGEPAGVKVWSPEGDLLVTLNEPALNAYAVAMSPDAKLLATGGYDPPVHVWNAETGELLKSLPGHTSNVFGVTFSPDGLQVAAVGQDGSARTWNVESGQPSDVLLTGLGALRVVAFSPDGRQLAVSNYGNDLYLQDLTTPEEPPRHVMCRCRPISAIVYSPEGRRLFVSAYDGQVLVFDPKTGRELGFLNAHNGAVNDIFIDRQARLITAGMDRLIKVWDTWLDGASNDSNFTQISRRGNFEQILFTPDGTRLLLPNSVNRTSRGSGSSDLFVWNLAKRKLDQTLSGHTRSLTGVAVTQDSAWYATSSADETVRIWDARAGRSVHELRGHTAAVTCVAFSPDGNSVASGSGDATVRLWDRPSGNLIHVLSSSGGAVRRVAFAPGGKLLASACENGAIDLWNVADGKLQKSVQAHSGPVTGLAFSHRGEFLASAGDDQLVRLWEVTTGQPIHSLQGHTAAVVDLAFSPDDRRLASVGDDHLVKLWDPKYGEEAFTLYQPDKIATIAFHPDGESFAVSNKSVVTTFSTRPLRTDAEKRVSYNQANLSWHRAQALDCIAHKLPFAAGFHCDRWAELAPNSLELEAVRSQLEMMLQEGGSSSRK